MNKYLKYVLTGLTILTVGSCVTMKNGEFIDRDINENKDYAFVYEVGDCGLDTLVYMHNKSQIVVEATVTETEVYTIDGFLWRHHEKKTLSWDEGVITIEKNNAYKMKERWIETAVNGKFRIANMVYYNMGDKRAFTTPSGKVTVIGHTDYPRPSYEWNEDKYSKYHLAAEELCQTIAENRLIEAMNAAGGQAIFMPNYNWSYEYKDSDHKPYKIKKMKWKDRFKEEEKTSLKVVHLTITATAVDFLLQK